MPPELTPDELKFFETGELPESLATPAEPAPAPEIATPAEPAPAELTLDRLAELRAQLERERALRTQAEAAMREALAAKVAPAPEVPKVAPPDPATDPLGAMMHKLNEVTNSVTTLKEQLTQEQLAAQQKTEFENFVTNIRAVRDDFTKTQAPDFNAAYDHLRKIRTQDLRDVGVPEDRIQQALLHDEVSLSTAALQRGDNPAKVLYDMAKRYGFISGRTQPPPTPAQKLAAVAAASAATKSAAPASHAAEPATPESLKQMGDADLNKLVLDDKNWAQIVGGTPSNDIFG